jgi:hypothetical protein
MSPTKTDVVNVQIVTTSGNFPASGFESFHDQQKLGVALNQSAAKLKLHNTSTWVATLNGRTLNPDLSFEANQIPNDSEIFWGPVAPGGGAR